MSPLAAAATLVNLLLATRPFTYPYAYMTLGPVVAAPLLFITCFLSKQLLIWSRQSVLPRCSILTDARSHFLMRSATANQSKKKHSMMLTPKWRSKNFISGKKLNLALWQSGSPNLGRKSPLWSFLLSMCMACWVSSTSQVLRVCTKAFLSLCMTRKVSFTTKTRGCTISPSQFSVGWVSGSLLAILRIARCFRLLWLASVSLW